VEALPEKKLMPQGACLKEKPQTFFVPENKKKKKTPNNPTLTKKKQHRPVKLNRATFFY